MKNYSRQREVILETLRENAVHPTAEELFALVREKIPNISLATVYRNLSMLESENKIIRIGSGGTARYDGNVSPHYHVTCLECGGVHDIFMDDDSLCKKAKKHFSGKILSHTVMFTGYCPECSEKIG